MPDAHSSEGVTGALSKEAFRKAARAAREAMPPAERSAADRAIAARVTASPEFARAEALFTYLSVGSEVDTRAIIAAALAVGKVVALPRVVPGTRQMTWHIVASLEGMERSPLGIEEPPAGLERIDPCAFAQGHATLALVPGLTFDAHGNRIGYGGGFYDAFLAKFPGPALGLCRASALVSDLAAEFPLELHDLPVTRVIAG